MIKTYTKNGFELYANSIQTDNKEHFVRLFDEKGGQIALINKMEFSHSIDLGPYREFCSRHEDEVSALLTP